MLSDVSLTVEIVTKEIMKYEIFVQMKKVTVHSIMH